MRWEDGSLFDALEHLASFMVEINCRPKAYVPFMPRIDGAIPLRQFGLMEPKIKVVGTRRRDTDFDPVSCHRRAVALIRQANKLSPFPRPRGFVFKARTWANYESWKKAQDNPRLW